MTLRKIIFQYQKSIFQYRKFIHGHKCIYGYPKFELWMSKIQNCVYQRMNHGYQQIIFNIETKLLFRYPWIIFQYPKLWLRISIIGIWISEILEQVLISKIHLWISKIIDIQSFIFRYPIFIFQYQIFIFLYPISNSEFWISRIIHWYLSFKLWIYINVNVLSLDNIGECHRITSWRSWHQQILVTIHLKSLMSSIPNAILFNYAICRYSGKINEKLKICPYLSNVLAT